MCFLFQAEWPSATPAFGLAALIFAAAERTRDVLLFVLVAVESVLVSDGSIDVVIIEVDVDFRAVAAGFPAGELVQLFVAHECRYLGQPGVSEVVGPAFVLRNVGAFAGVFEPAEKSIVLHSVSEIWLVIASVIVVVAWDVTTVFA